MSDKHVGWTGSQCIALSNAACQGDDIEITILGVKGNQVRLGIKAPKHIRVDREEIYRRIQLEEYSTHPK